MTPAERQEAEEVKFTTCTETEGACRFVARAVQANSINDVRAMYKALLLDPDNAMATHNIAAYKLYSPQGALTTEGHNDDGDHGMGRVVLNTMQKANAKNVAVFVTRHYGGSHLGSKRLTAIEKVVNDVLAAYKNN